MPVYDKTMIHYIGCIEEIAWKMGFIDDSQLSKLAVKYAKSGYGEYLDRILKEGK